MPNRPLRRALWCGALIFVVQPGAYGALHGQSTFTVTNDTDLDDGTCDADCSLREAINAANANAPLVDIIDFSVTPGAAPFTISPLSALPTITESVSIDGASDIVLSGASAGANVAGLQVTGGPTTIRDLTINGFATNAGVLIQSDGNTLLGNALGTDPSVTSAAPNFIGVRVESGAGNTIGGTSGGLRNFISGNISHGISLTGTSSVTVIHGNYIGTDATGGVALGNGGNGVSIDDADDNTLGGTATGAGNVISENALAGVYISGSATGNDVQGNVIGADAALVGTRLGNATSGVHINGASGNSVGGTSAGARNVIGANGEHGVLLSGGATGNIVQRNMIESADGVTHIGNTKNGITVAASGNAIGGTAVGAGNFIAFQGRDGVAVVSGTGNSVLGNSIFHNHTLTNPGGTYLGIDLSDDDVTLNDSDDPDGGANNLQNFPVITSAVDGGTIVGSLNSAATTQFRLEFFSNSTADPDGFVCDRSGNGEGETFIGSIDVTTDGSGDFNFSTNFGPLAPGDFITATATDPGNNTSEFSACFQVGGADVEVTKTGPATVNAGASYSYTLTVCDIKFEVQHGLFAE